MHASARCLPVLAILAALVLVTTPGCTRHFYRQAADKDVEGVITQKDIFPSWKLTNWNVYPNPMARYADNSNPDRPPYPPDDYAARLTSPNPQRPTKKSGVGRVDGTGYLAYLQKWDAENRANDAAEAAGNPPKQTSSSPPALDLPVAGVMAPPIPERTSSPDRAVRHTVPAGIPAALRPGSGGASGGQPQASASPILKPALGAEFGPWTAVRPSIPGPVVTDRGHGMAITELRQPVIVVGGEVEQNGKSVPAIAVVPMTVEPPLSPVGMQPLVPQPPQQPPAPQPQPGPQQPEPLPLPKVADPMAQPQTGGPLGQATPGPTDSSVLDTQYLAALESKQPGYRLTLEQSVELGVLNARELQDRREDVYLAALPVTLQRFNFAAMGFFTQQAVLQSLGRNVPGGGGEKWTLSSNGSVSKLFPTGALLMVKLANQVVIDLSNGKPTTTIGNFSLSLMQPFLQGGGLAVNLEDLTFAERNLLYALRSFARFRKLFFVAVAAGAGGYTNNPYGLQGLSVNLGRGVGSNLTAPNVGYLPLVYQQAVINNQKRNVAALERLLQLYLAYREGGQFADLQVGLVEVQLLNSRSALLGSPLSTNGSTNGMRGYLDTLDNFKLQLGLPLTVNLELDDAAVKPIRQHLIRFEDVYAQVQEVELAGAKYNPAEPVAAFRKRWLTLFTESALVRGTPFAKNIVARWESWSPAKLNDEQMRRRLADLREERRKLLAERVERELKKVPEPPAEIRRLATLNTEIDLGTFESLVRTYEAQPWANKTGKERSMVQEGAFTAAYNAFYLVILEARNDRLAALYASWPQLESLSVGGIDVRDASLDDAYTAAIQTALSNRLDLMNARAEVVDAWRQIAVIANSLRGVFNVEYDLSSTTPTGGNTPLGFSAGRDTNQLTFNVQLPIVRRAQRNNYRQSLIAYQRQRRTLMAFEDNIANDVRSDVRELRTLIQLYRIQQRVIQVAYAQVDNATAILFAPPVPGAGSDAGSAAALTLQVLQARTNLLAAQNTLYQLWVSYLTSRMSFYLDLEYMQLDDRGVWTDELFNRTDSTNRPTQSGERLHAPQPLVPNDGGNPGQGR